MTGFYDQLGDEDRFVVLTTAENGSMMGTHDRMPLILEEGQVKDWIFCWGKVEEILRLVPGVWKRGWRMSSSHCPLDESREIIWG